MLTTPTKFHLFFYFFNFAWTFLSKGGFKAAAGDGKAKVKLGEGKGAIEFRSAKVGVGIKIEKIYKLQ
ncbi:hypothetical protein HMPREF9980_08623 [Staphylococcus epidermidis NIHLM031]|nr:hypothetical protein HMPREF9980_08623 [Staphylococcus epidermidis NIHLM031]